MPWALANKGGRAVLVSEEGVYDLERWSEGRFTSDPMAAISRFDELDAVAEAARGGEPDDVFDPKALGPPAPRPQKVFGIGLNYRAHAAESNLEPPTVPLVFTKFPNCLVGPTADVVLSGPKVDWEAELVVVIGRRGRNIPAASAWDHVAGLTVGQDISDRDTQFAVRPPQFSLGKSYDTFGPIGPVVISTDAVPDRDDLALSCDVSGQRMQEARTSDLIFPVPELVAYLSGITTLEPGDLIFTGTPEGVGMGRGRLLVEGDVIETTIAGIGTMTNRCVNP